MSEDIRRALRPFYNPLDYKSRRHTVGDVIVTFGQESQDWIDLDLEWLGWSRSMTLEEVFGTPPPPRR